jgi:hypothetical protein
LKNKLVLNRNNTKQNCKRRAGGKSEKWDISWISALKEKWRSEQKLALVRVTDGQTARWRQTQSHPQRDRRTDKTIYKRQRFQREMKN